MKPDWVTDRATHLGLFVFTLTFLIFLPTVFFDFVALDDSKHLYSNIFLNPPSMKNFYLFWTAPYFGLYAPVLYCFWTVEAFLSYFISGSLSPYVFHFFNVVLHSLNSLLVFTIVYRLLIHSVKPKESNDRKYKLAAFAGSLFFAAHPLQVEPVAWASGSKDLLSACLALLGIWILFFSQIRKYQRWFVSSLLYFAAILVKPSTVVVPVICLFINWIYPAKKRDNLFPLLGVWFFAALALVLVTKWQQPDSRLDAIVPLWQRPFVAADAILFYLLKIFAPLGLAPDYGRTPESVMRTSWVYLYSCLPMLLAIYLFKYRKSAKALFAGASFWFLSVSPVLGFIAFEFQNMSTVADRYMYLPMLGISLILAEKAVHLKKTKLLMIYSIAGLMVIGSLIQSQKWKNNIELFKHTTTINPKSFTGFNNLGFEYFRQENYEKAILNFNKSLAIKADYLPAENNLGATYLRLKEYKRVISHYKEVLQRHADLENSRVGTYAEVHFNLGAGYINSGDMANGLTHLKRCTEINPNHAKAFYHLGRIYLHQRKYPLAGEHFARALSIQPNHQEAKAGMEKARRLYLGQSH